MDKTDFTEWTSENSTVWSIRTDDHTQLTTADPDPSIPVGNVDRMFAISVTEVGKKGDAVIWRGRSNVLPKP
jgi:hypothetical protein